MEGPLTGIRVLSLEQAVALPTCTRILADLGADVIRAQSHKRAGGRASFEAGANDVARNKQQLGIDLSAPEGQELFRRLASRVDVVCHNFTSRVVRQFGIDYETIRDINASMIYLTLSGFGRTGPWGGRPLFGPGSEAVSGFRSLVGSPGRWPGRPGAQTYADSLCGLHAAFGILAGIDYRDRTGEGTHIDVSLYETSVSHLGVAVAEQELGVTPEQIGNQHNGWAIHDLFRTRGDDAFIAVAATTEQLDHIAQAVEMESFDGRAFEQLAADWDADALAQTLQAAGVAASRVNDVSHVVTDRHLWSRGYFVLIDHAGTTGPHVGLPMGGGSFVEARAADGVGAHTARILEEVAEFDPTAIGMLFANDIVGEAEAGRARQRVASGAEADHQTRIDRGELSRVDPAPDGWKRFPGSAHTRSGGIR